MDEKIVKEAKDLANDTISRKAAIEALEKIDCSDGVGISLLKCDMVDDAVTAIKALPSAQPKRMPGKWIDDGDPFMWVCDVCGYRVKRYNNTRYCPHCGAKMEVGDGSD